MIFDYIALDVETTGLNPAKDRVLEIGAARIVKGEVCETYSALVDPGIPVPLRIQQLTGITEDMRKSGRKSGQIFPEFLDFCGELPILGHNVSFDFGFLKQEAAGLGLTFEKEAVDTLKLARKLLPEAPSRRLEALCSHYQIDPGHAHRALCDALSSHQLYLKLWEEFGETVPEAFRTEPMIYSVKKQSPITNSQKAYLIDLMKYHRIEPNIRIEDMTKSEASRMIDGIILEHGRIIR